MQTGVAEVRGTFWGFVFFGASYQHLWFRPDGGTEKTKIIASEEASPAHRCGACGAVAIPPRNSFTDRMKGAAKQVSDYMEKRDQTKRPPAP